MNSICPMNFFSFDRHDRYDRYNDMETRLYGNLPYKCSMQKKRQIQLFVRDRMNSICPMNFFRTTDTTDTTDTTIWKPGFSNDDGNGKESVT